MARKLLAAPGGTFGIGPAGTTAAGLPLAEDRRRRRREARQ